MEQNLNKNFSPINIKKAWEELKKANSVTFLTHSRPDGDGISACAALSNICERLCKDVETIYPNKPEFPVKRIAKNILINQHKQIPDLIIIFDTANYERIYFPKEFELIPSINIDHHLSNTINATFNFVDEKTSSACEILFNLIQEWNEDLFDQYTCETLLLGILYDSLVFQTQNTTAQTLRVAAKLMDLGANLFELKTELLANKSPQIIALWGDVLKSVKVSPKGNVVWTKVTKKDMMAHNVTPTSLIGFNNFLSRLCEVDITLLFYETKTGQTKVSLRSKKADVNLLASNFGGGGHKNAAGILSDKPIDQLIEEITKIL